MSAHHHLRRTQRSNSGGSAGAMRRKSGSASAGAGKSRSAKMARDKQAGIRLRSGSAGHYPLEDEDDEDNQAIQVKGRLYYTYVTKPCDIRHMTA